MHGHATYLCRGRKAGKDQTASKFTKKNLYLKRFLFLEYEVFVLQQL